MFRYQCADCSKERLTSHHYTAADIVQNPVKQTQLPRIDTIFGPKYPICIDECDSSAKASPLVKLSDSQDKLNTLQHDYDICIKCRKPLIKQLAGYNSSQTDEKFSTSTCDAKEQSLPKQAIEHTGANKEEKSFTCSKCNKTFRAKGSLTRHNRCVHESKKRSSSDNCDDFFVQKGNLLFHKGETYFTCLTCARIFPTKARLTTHIRIH